MALDTDFTQLEPKSGNKRVLDYVINDLNKRAESGKEKYGTYLETFNGRNALFDGYMEVLDLAMYIKQKLLEENTEKLIIGDACEISFDANGVHFILSEVDANILFNFLNKINKFRIIFEEVNDE